jgi:mono/diheme cytochrome c family protein
MGRAPIGVALLVLPLVAACSTPLPDPQSAGAQVYQVRCSGCHPLYAPRSLTAAMWEVQVDRMQQEMLRRAVNPLTEQERYLVLSYLKAHATETPELAASASPAP